jgi:aspartyl-tRNA(Asn)/glutamyl-tRNA(Gln) amidotransferase subunit A
MNQDEICDMPATRMAGLIASRHLSPVEVTEAVLARVARLNPSLNAFALLLPDEALAAARKAEADVMSGQPLGPLHGVPVTVKDNISLAGVPMRNGSIAAEAVQPATDAVAVGRVKAAGAIVIGKTTLPEFAHKVLTENFTEGLTLNPWNREHSPGGSSGGAGAALAAGLAPLAVATDGGGSIRCPAAWNGVVGLKPTLGRIPSESAPDGFGNFAYIGPMARVTDDVALLLSVMQGACPADPFALATPAEPEPMQIRGLRVGWIAHFGEYRTEADVLALTQAAVSRLSLLGAEVEEVKETCFDGLYPVYATLASTVRARRYGHIFDAAGDKMTPTLRAGIAQGRSWSALDLLAASDRRTTLFRAMQALLERFDVLAMPTVTAPAPRLDSVDPSYPGSYPQWAAALHPFNLTGHPALSTPAGFTAAGLPVGLQLVGPWFAEQRLLMVSSALEQSLGLVSRRPPIEVPQP